MEKESDCCRLCFLQVKEYINIFDNSALMLNIPNALEQYFHDVASVSDIYPKVICCICWAKVETFRKFTEKVIALREHYTHMHPKNTVKNEQHKDCDVPSTEPEIHQEVVCVETLHPIKMEIENESIALDEGQIYYESADDDNELYDDIFDLDEEPESNEIWPETSIGQTNEHGNSSDNLRYKSRRKPPKRVPFVEPEICPCKRQCSARIDLARQKVIFNEYHSDESWSGRTKFLRDLVKVCEPKSHKISVNPMTRNKSRKRENLFLYFFKDDQGVSHQVCQTFLLQLLQVTRTRLYRAIITGNSNPSGQDRRGRWDRRSKDTEDVQFVKDFIAKFPKYESCYSKSQSKVLHRDLTVKKLYDVYHAHCSSANRTPTSLRQFYGFELSFAKRRTQTCRICNKLETKIKKSKNEVQTQLNQTKQKHCDLASKIINDFENEVKTANDSIGTEVFTFALGQSIGLPEIKPVDYTKRQFWLHEFGIFDEVRKLSYVYTWPESVASKGSQEIGSCILRHLHETLSPQTKQLILYCDPNFGQNRNINLSLVLQYFLDSWPHPHLESIQQRFFVSGHGFNNCDRSFDEIKKKGKSTRNIFVPSQRIDFINELEKTCCKISAAGMNGEHFLATKTLENLISNKTVAIDGRKIDWTSYHSITCNRNEPFILHIKRYDDVAFDIILRKQNANDKLSSVTLPILYPNGRKISKPKYNDLRDLIEHIPKKYHTFFESLKYSDSNADKDYVFSVRGSSDEEEEDKDFSLLSIFN